ncbi:MAG: type II toxin-antitoxin system VapC family toxin [Akkermansiaceae bacterium]
MLILADTNIWCNYFRSGDDTLSQLIEFDFLTTHPLVIGELAVGNLPKRKQTIVDLHTLPRVKSASYKETFYLLEENKLWGKGLQWNDLLILAAVVTSPDTLLWTRDKRLAAAAAEFSVSYSPS